MGTTYGNVIENIPQGETFSLQRYGFGLTSNQIISNITWWVKRNITDSDANALFAAAITTAGSLQGSITYVNVQTGEIQFTLILPGVSVFAYVTVGIGNASVTWTSLQKGYQFGQIAIQYVVAGINTPLSVVVSGTPVPGSVQSGNTITVNVATDGSGNSISTAAQIMALVNADASAGLIVQGTLPPLTDGSSFVVAQSLVHLAGGVIGTADLFASTPYRYRITLNLTDGTEIIYEDGTLATRASIDVTLTSTRISGARASETGSVRADNIINTYVDATLEVFRSLPCWDMRGRRYANDPSLITFPYKHWNRTFVPEVYDDQDVAIPASLIQVDYDAGTFRVQGEAGIERYYCTFRFDYFGTDVLEAFMALTLQELNVAGAEGRYLTNYMTVDQTPLFWDAPLWMGIVEKCYRRLAADSALWTSKFIWANPNSNEGPQFVMDLANQMDSNLSELKRSLKWGRFLAKPTSTFRLFESVGFGFFTYAGSRFRGMELNTLAAV